MIKAKKGKVMCKGVMSDVLVEYAYVTRAIIKGLEDDMPREDAARAVAEAHRVGTLTKEEMAEEVKAKVTETTMKIANAMNGNNEEKGESDND